MALDKKLKDFESALHRLEEAVEKTKENIWEKKKLNLLYSIFVHATRRLDSRRWLFSY